VIAVGSGHEPCIDEHTHERGRFAGLEGGAAIAPGGGRDEIGDGLVSVEAFRKFIPATSETVEATTQRILEQVAALAADLLESPAQTVAQAGRRRGAVTSISRTAKSGVSWEELIFKF